jgi:predicted CopG family antitoxin
MPKKLTVTLDEDVYEGLHRVIGRQKISQFIEALVRPHVVPQDWADAYQEMAADEEHEGEAHEWAEATLRDFPEGDR